MCVFFLDFVDETVPGESSCLTETGRALSTISIDQSTEQDPESDDSRSNLESHNGDDDGEEEDKSSSESIKVTRTVLHCHLFFVFHPVYFIIILATEETTEETEQCMEQVSSIDTKESLDEELSSPANAPVQIERSCPTGISQGLESKQNCITIDYGIITHVKTIIRQ